MKNILDKFHEGHVNMQNMMDNLIAKSDADAKRKQFCTNMRTLVTHKVLTSFDSSGPGARTYCMWKYAQSYVRVVGELGVRCDRPCKECFLELSS